MSAGVSTGLRFRYGVGQLSDGVINDSFGIFLLFYYREVLGLSGTLAGLALLISLAIDAITDPLVGDLSDRTHSRYGRRHPYMFASVLPVTLSYYFVFAPPSGLSQLALFCWLTTFTVLARFAMTLFAVPHMALGAELAEDYDERTKIVSARMAFSTLGRGLAGFLGLLVFMRPTETFPRGQLNPAAYPPFAFATALLIGVPILLSALTTTGVIGRLRTPDAGAVHDPSFSGLLGRFRACLRIRNFRVHFLGSTLAFVAWGVMGTLGLHLATFFWRVSTDVLAVWGVAMFSGLFAGLGFWNQVATKHEKKVVFLRGMAVFLVFSVPPLLGRALGLWPSDDSPAYLWLYLGMTGFLAYFGIASTLVTGGSMMADITDEDELAHGRRREGIFFGAIAFSSKAAMGVGAQLGGLLLDLVGLAPGSDPASVSPEVTTQLGIAVGITLAILVGASMRVYHGYDLTRARLVDIRRRLAHAL